MCGKKIHFCLVWGFSNDLSNAKGVNGLGIYSDSSGVNGFVHRWHVGYIWFLCSLLHFCLVWGFSNDLSNQEG